MPFAGRLCGMCRRVLRWDEALERLCVDEVGAFLACPDCVAGHSDAPRPPHPTYPHGARVPQKPGGGDIDICGVCRRAMYEGESPQGLRIREEMLTDGETLEPGGYAACRECREAWRPRVYQWLVTYDADRLPAGFDVRSCTGGWLE